VRVDSSLEDASESLHYIFRPVFLAFYISKKRSDRWQDSDRMLWSCILLHARCRETSTNLRSSKCSYSYYRYPTLSVVKRINSLETVGRFLCKTRKQRFCKVPKNYSYYSYSNYNKVSKNLGRYRST